MIIQQDMDLMKKLTILSDAAKYDAACTSSGVDKKITVRDWAMRKPVASATVSQPMADVFPY